MIYALKIFGMWFGLAYMIHLAHCRAYMLMWIASGHVTSWKVKWHDFIYEISLILGTLYLWLDHYNKL